MLSARKVRLHPMEAGPGLFRPPRPPPLAGFVRPDMLSAGKVRLQPMEAGPGHFRPPRPPPLAGSRRVRFPGHKPRDSASFREAGRTAPARLFYFRRRPGPPYIPRAGRSLPPTRGSDAAGSLAATGTAMSTDAFEEETGEHMKVPFLRQYLPPERFKGSLTSV